MFHHTTRTLAVLYSWQLYSEYPETGKTKQNKISLNQKWINEMFIYTIGYDSAIENEDIMNFAGK